MSRKKGAYGPLRDGYLNIKQSADILRSRVSIVYDWCILYKIIDFTLFGKNLYISLEEVEKIKLPDGYKRCSCCCSVDKLEMFRCHKCYKCIAKVSKTYNQKHYKSNRENLLFCKKKQAYNISKERYEELKSQANGICPICLKNKDLVIDHNHKTKEIRGLLCKHCNTGLGFFFEDKKSLENAIVYLNKFSNKEIKN